MKWTSISLPALVAAVFAGGCAHEVKVTESPGRIENPIIRQDFKQLDANKDGVISRSEYEAKPEVVRNLHIYDQFNDADFDRDGVVDMAEFAAFEEPVPAE